MSKDLNEIKNPAEEPVDAVLDATGLYCPEPVMLVHNKIRELEAGQILKILATDPSTTRDIPKFCMFLGHDLVAQQELDNQFEYLIRKKAD